MYSKVFHLIVPYLIFNPFYHKKQTEETKIKMSEGHKRYLESGKHHKAKQIKIIIDDIEYNFLSKREA